MNRIPAVFVSCFLFYIVHPTCCIGGITVINGDAETGDLTGWTASGAASAATDVLYSAGTATPDQGDWFFSFARPASTTGELEQTGTMEIGNGPALRLSGIYLAESGLGDTAEAVLTLLDADSAQVAQRTTGRMFPRSNRWQTFSVDVAVPPTATSWRMNLLGNRGSSGSHIDSFVDDIRLGILGDFNRDGELTIHDLETLALAIQSTDAGVPMFDLDRLRFDLDRSGVVDSSDRQHWITELRQTWLGDANLDGQVNAADLNALALSWRGTATSWSQGDFTGDGNVDAFDLHALALNWNSGVAAAASAPTVPEPSSIILVLLGVCVLVRRAGRAVG